MSLLVPVRFALLRVRAHAQRTLVVAAGIAVAAAALAMTAVGSVAVQDRAAQRALAQLQPSDRAVQAVWSGVPGQSDLSLPALDPIAAGGCDYTNIRPLPLWLPPRASCTSCKNWR